MNIFILDKRISRCASYLCDKHVVKMCLETAQLLCSVYDEGVAPYKRTHYNHPCSVWTRRCLNNWEWLLNLGYAICEEYHHRYGKVHKCFDVLEWCADNKPDLKSLPTKTAFVYCGDDEFRELPVIDAYRLYYQSKVDGGMDFRYTGREVPWWLHLEVKE